MKKYALTITLVGFIIQCFAAGFMLYGVNNNQSLYNTGTLLFFTGLMVIAIGLITVALKNK